MPEIFRHFQQPASVPRKHFSINQKNMATGQLSLQRFNMLLLKRKWFRGKENYFTSCAFNLIHRNLRVTSAMGKYVFKATSAQHVVNKCVASNTHVWIVPNEVASPNSTG